MSLFGKTIKKFNNQDYKKLKNEAVSSGCLFTDSSFPPSKNSLAFKELPSNVQWKRPGELHYAPQLLVEGADDDDFQQGELGDCWFVAACACIANSKIWKKIIPDYEEQEWPSEKRKKNKYGGIFHFRLWIFGEVTDVVIDDYLPTRNGHLIYVHSSAKNEFWSALLEKAYAKLFGSYEALVAGISSDALVDLTSGVGHIINMEDYVMSEAGRNELFDILDDCMDQSSFINASIPANGKSEMELRTEVGLVKGHAYSITAAKDIKIGTGLMAVFSKERIKMVRCRNPWGGTEWTGAWSDGSEEWKKVSSAEKKQLGLVFDDNGEFWMSYDDFCKYFERIYICHMFNTSVLSIKKTWHETILHSEWAKPDRAGGCGNHRSHLLNPQFVFDIVKKKDDVVISLEQEDARVNKHLGKTAATIGLVVYKADLNRKYRMHDKLKYVGKTAFSNNRGCYTKIQLTRGRYLIIPTTFDPGQELKFMLRIYVSKNPNAIELIYDEPQLPQQPSLCCISPPRTKSILAQIEVVKAEGLEKQDRVGGADPYCVFTCEGEKVTTSVVEDTLDPVWDDRITFYQVYHNSEITVEIMNENVVRDKFMGGCVFTSTECDELHTWYSFTLSLYGKGKEGKDEEKEKVMPGKLCIRMRTSYDLAKY
ncbi:calpain-5-like [Lineus longissimus]|uniref:calpain-5-like n=1 Tax=Lineus longissimus TaxID=88925 RepID=UPI002B4F4D0A